MELRAPKESEATTATAAPAKAPQAAAPTGNPVSSGVDVTHTAEYVAPGFKLVLYTSAIDATWDVRPLSGGDLDRNVDVPAPTGVLIERACECLGTRHQLVTEVRRLIAHLAEDECLAVAPHLLQRKRA